MVSHRLSPKENENLNKQVVDLLEKGLIHEIFSPCSVSALITHKKDGT
jgi:hypothetical protein